MVYLIDISKLTADNITCVLNEYKLTKMRTYSLNMSINFESPCYPLSSSVMLFCSVLYNVRLLFNPLLFISFCVHISEQKGNMPLRIYWKNSCIDYCCKYEGWKLQEPQGKNSMKNFHHERNLKRHLV